MNKTSFKQLAGTIILIGTSLNTTNVGAVGGTITGQLVNAKTGELICAEALINGNYRTYTCTADGLNRGAPFTLPYDYIQGSTDTSANKLLLFASGYAPAEELITQPNQNVKVEMTRIEDLGSPKTPDKKGFQIALRDNSSPLCIDVPGSPGVESGLNVLIWPCESAVDENSDHRWRYTNWNIVNVQSDKCLSMDREDGNKAKLLDCGSVADRWLIIGGSIKNNAGQATLCLAADKIEQGSLLRGENCANILDGTPDPQQFVLWGGNP